MKTIKILIVILFIYQINTALSQDKETTLKAQKYEVKVNNIESSTLNLLNIAGDIIITANNSSNIIIEASGIKKTPKRADGLKRISSGGVDNTGVGLNYTIKGNTIKLYGAVSMNSSIKYKISIPEKLKIYVNLGMFNNNDLTITDLKSDLELDVKTSNIKLKNVTGPTVISSLSGDIEAVFSTISQKSPFSIKAISGDIDISLPTNTPANLKLSCISGGIYSDFDIKFSDEKASNLNYISGGSTVHSKLNNGGVEISVRAISGNIYLRKKK